MKTITDNQLNGEVGEALVKARFGRLGLVFESRGRLETGIDGTVELRDAVTGRMLGKTIACQVKTTTSDRYTRETDAGFEYLLRLKDLDFWRSTNLPVIIVLHRMEDDSFYWKGVEEGAPGEERRLAFDKVADRLDAASLDRLASLAVERGRLGSYVPPMRTGEPAHLNLMRIAMPATIYVGQSQFGSGRDAIPTLLRAGGRRFDWVIRGRRFVSFADPAASGMGSIVEPGTVEAVDTEAIAASDDRDDEVATVELLRRTAEEQFRPDLAYDKEAKAFHFRAPVPLAAREFAYRSLREDTSATVVQLYPDKKVPGRLGTVRHHAFAPRFERIGDDWFVSISPTFAFTEDGSRPHRLGPILLAGKKRLDRSASVRGQVFLWRHFLAQGGAAPAEPPSLFAPAGAPATRPQVLCFLPVDPVAMERSVPEDAWATSDPNASRLKPTDDADPAASMGRLL